MADPCCTVPYHNAIADNMIFDEENFGLGLVQQISLSETEPYPLDHAVQDVQTDDQGIADLLGDPVSWGVLDSIMENPGDQAGPSEFRGQSIPREEISQPQCSEFGNPVQLLVWPAPPVPHCCTCCQVLREITHTNGVHMTRFEIHGRLGMICHAILEERYRGDSGIRTQHQMFDFCKKSLEAVREFLVQYCKLRKESGYVMVQDPLLTFYQALCVGLNGDDSVDTDAFLQTSPPGSDEFYTDQQEAETQSEEARPPKSSLSAQRERTGKLTLKDFSGYFRLPIDTAAKKMNICPTVMKKICRRNGLSRWPYRKVKSIETKISNTRKSLRGTTGPEERARAEAHIKSLQQELATILAGF